MIPAIELRDLTKVYRTVRALDGVDLEVPQGSVYGFLGPNGAGKTTALRILSGLSRPTSGSAHVLGNDTTLHPDQVRGVIGFLPDVPGFYSWMTGEEFLRLSGRLFGLSGRVLDQRVGALLDLAGLSGVETKVGGYSRGMRQRLGVAQALINAPRVLMLDEPTSALDPIGRRDVLDMIAGLAGRTTVFFSTHILSDVERVCDTVAILHRGRLAAQASIDDLKARHGIHKVRLTVSGPARELAAVLQSAPWATHVEHPEDDCLELSVQDLAAAQVAIPREIAALGIGLRRLEAVELSLEDVFVDLVGSGLP